LLPSPRFEVDPDFGTRLDWSGVGSVLGAAGEGVVAIVGKTLRRSFDRAAGASALHVVTAFAAKARLVLGQKAVPGTGSTRGTGQRLRSPPPRRNASARRDRHGADQHRLEQVVSLKERGRGDGHGHGEEQREGRHQHRAEAAPGKRGQPGNDHFRCGRSNAGGNDARLPGPQAIAHWRGNSGRVVERLRAAAPERIPASVLLMELRERGYTGGDTMLRTLG
jgi:hypothetical protein